MNGVGGSTDFDIRTISESLPGIGGVIKSCCEDFEVEEIPAYTPAGEGQHLFLWIEKRNLSAKGLLRHLSDRLSVAQRSIGMAGLKDKHAVTRQFCSVPFEVESKLGRVDSDQVQLHWSKRHRNKLRSGHLKGNRFRILVRDAVPDAVDRSRAIADLINQSGFPNFFGPQRFGRASETLRLGMELLEGRDSSAEPKHGAHSERSRQNQNMRRTKPKGNFFTRKLALSAVQSALFNRYLNERITKGWLHTVIDGDVMNKLDGGMFYVTDPEKEQARFDDRQIVHTGPIFGSKMFAAKAKAKRLEAKILEDSGISPKQFLGFGTLLQGTRRRNLVYLDDLQVIEKDEGIEFQFSLPAGSYAVLLLNEFMKSGLSSLDAMMTRSVE